MPQPVFDQILALSQERQTLWRERSRELHRFFHNFGPFDEARHTEVRARLGVLETELHRLWAARRRERSLVGLQGGF